MQWVGKFAIFDSGELVADTLTSLHTIKRFFCHYFRILPQNMHYTSSREYFNELYIVWMQFWRQYVENRAIKQRSHSRRGDVTRWTSGSSARRAISFSV